MHRGVILGIKKIAKQLRRGYAMTAGYARIFQLLTVLPNRSDGYGRSSIAYTRRSTGLRLFRPSRVRLGTFAPTLPLSSKSRMQRTALSSLRRSHSSMHLTRDSVSCGSTFQASNPSAFRSSCRIARIVPMVTDSSSSCPNLGSSTAQRWWSAGPTSPLAPRHGGLGRRWTGSPGTKRPWRPLSWHATSTMR